MGRGAAGAGNFGSNRRRDLDDIDSVFEARRTAGEQLDCAFLDHCAAEWGLTDRLARYRAEFKAS